MSNLLTAKCKSCDYEVHIPITKDQLSKYKNGEPIQRVLPNVSPDDRELFISGLCGKCFDKMFS